MGRYHGCRWRQTAFRATIRSKINAKTPCEGRCGSWHGPLPFYRTFHVVLLARQTRPSARGTIQSDHTSSPFERGSFPTIHPSLPFKPQDSPGSAGSSPGRYRRRPDSFGILGTDAPTVENNGVRKRDVNDASRRLRSHLACIVGPSRSGKGEMSGYTTPQRSVMQEVRRLGCRGTLVTRREGASFEGTCGGSEIKLTMDACHKGLRNASCQSIGSV